MRVSGQRGFALMLMLVVIVTALGAVLFGLLRPSTAASYAVDRVTLAALAQARDALIGSAATDDNHPGSLPCPDLDNDGQLQSAGETFGNCASLIGRLPWRTLGLPDLRDSSGERLWYVLSSNFRDNAASSPLNSDTAGQLTITGTNPAANVIAIVFAPGPALTGQARDAASQNNVTNYLEGENANGDTVYTVGAATNSFNDTLVAITSDMLFPAVESRVAREIRANLATYFTANSYYPNASNYGDATFSCVNGVTRGRLPKPGVGGDYAISSGCTAPAVADWGAAQPPVWFTVNNWHLLTYYAVAPACTVANPNCGGAGYLTVTNLPSPNNDKRALVIVAGRALTGQFRPCASVSDCLDGAENTNGDDVYIKNPVSPTFNDKITVVAP